MSSTTFHFLDLPQDIVNQILLRLDFDTIINVGKTCTALKHLVDAFKDSHKMYISKKMVERKVRIVLAGDEDTDDDYADYDDNNQETYSDVDDIQQLMDEMYDRASWGSNYDEECEEFINQL